MTDKNIPAFPCCGNPDTDQMINGMTLRDWFAGMALQGVITHKSWISFHENDDATFAYKIADAMMKARGE